jgi:type I restriction enzyme M protein
MDASQYKDYILVFLFIKYLSDKVKSGQSIIDLPPEATFDAMVKLKNNPNIGDLINKQIIGGIVEHTPFGLSDFPDFNDDEKLGRGKEKVQRLTKLVGIFQSEALNFSSNSATDDDLLGDAYEYLMRHFATESGKSKGQFYTPAEVSRVLAKVVGVKRARSADETVYDPTCGSGSLLLKVADEAPMKISVFGQEMDNATFNLARMNMWMHNYESADIRKGNTLAAPAFLNKRDDTLERFDYVVANPPFSAKSWTNGLLDDKGNLIDTFERFRGYGTPPGKNGDYAFLLHILKSLKSTGKAAVILPHGVLFRGNAEAAIRENIIRRGYIKAIIGLPANLFYGTGIPACIIVLDKEGAEERKAIFMIEASRGYVKDGNKNRLRERDIHKIVDAFNTEAPIPRYSRLVPIAEIEKNEYNLNLPRYIDTQEPEDMQNIEAHLHGGIPQRDIDELQRFWEVYPTLKKKLFRPAGRSGFFDLAVSSEAIKTTIYEHPEFQTYGAQLQQLFQNWAEQNRPILLEIDQDTHPKELIRHISEDLLARYNQKPLVDKYSIYQILLNYWYESMRDDAYLIVEEGWRPQLSFDEKKKTWNSELIPKSLVTVRYFAEAEAAIRELEQKLEQAGQELEELKEEYGGEEGLLAEVTNDKGNITKGSVSNRLKEISKSREDREEAALLQRYLDLLEEEALRKKTIKAAERDLDQQLLLKYRALDEAAVKDLVVNHKWLAALEERILAEMDAISQRLAQRLQELAERYARPLPQIADEVAELENKVMAHLEKMGFVWK